MVEPGVARSKITDRTFRGRKNLIRIKAIMADRPNFLFIFDDQHRHDYLGASGASYLNTPHLDRIAEQGVRFTQAATNCPCALRRGWRWPRDYSQFGPACSPTISAARRTGCRPFISGCETTVTGRRVREIAPWVNGRPRAKGRSSRRLCARVYASV